MISQIRMTTTAAVTALALSGLLAQSADAGSLLSGYGGPGQGNQAILGATLLNGPGGGEGGGGAAGTQGAVTPSTGLAIGENRSASPGARSEGNPRQRSGGGTTTAPRASGSGSATLHTAPEASVGSPALGISGADLLYILLGLGALAVTGVVTRQLTRRP